MDYCDTGCRRHALTWWESSTDEEGWAFCLPCTARHADELKRRGYELWVDAREDEPVTP